MEKVLLIQNDSDILEREQKILSSMYDVTICNSGSETLNVAKNENFDCFVIDLKIGDVTGICLYQELLDLYSKPIVLIIEHASEILTMRKLNLKAMYFAKEPFASLVLLNEVNMSIKKYKENIKL